MRKNFILDTNVLLYDPNAINLFADNNVLIPLDVIEQLDTFKRDITELGNNARSVIQQLDLLRQGAKLGEGVALSTGGMLRVCAGDFQNMLANTGLVLNSSVDNRILNLAVYLHEHDSEHPTIIVTKSINLRIKADALGIYAEDFAEPNKTVADAGIGYHELERSSEDIDEFVKVGKCTLENGEFAPNAYVLFKSNDGSKKQALGRVVNLDPVKVVRLFSVQEGVLGIKPLNLGQCFAMDALLDDNIKLVTLLGKAGTGKTLIAVAAGLYKVVQEDIYNRVIVSRPTMPMGRDIGYIPGDIAEKMRPWMQPIFDAVELIREIDRRSRRRSLPPDILESDELGIEPLTYIRGRSIPHQFMIVDEAQNLTPHEVKTIVTRVGRGTKVVLTGDLHQIDNPYVDAYSNGFSYVIDRFRNEKIAAHIALTKGERSELAEVASNLL
jgi:PhoH-like ATPase